MPVSIAFAHSSPGEILVDEIQVFSGGIAFPVGFWNWGGLSGPNRHEPYIDFLDGQLQNIYLFNGAEPAGPSWDDILIDGNSFYAFGNYTDTYESTDSSVWTARGTIDYSAPEPATILLFTTGLVGLAGFRRKKKV